LKQFLLSVALLCCSMPGFGGAIDFETGAPPVFASTSPLTNYYAALGVIFSGPGAGLGGAILDQAGNFGLNARSGVDFLAFNTSSYAVGPETISFSSPVSNVGVWVGAAGTGPEYTLKAYDSLGGMIGSASVTPISGWSQIVMNLSGVSSLELSFTGSLAVVDDLTWDNSVSDVPEPATISLLGAGILGLTLLSRRRRNG
jgi:hypothetical protein